jgi:general stress protein 26
MAHDHVTKVAELLDGERFAMLSTTAPDGTLMSRPMALQEVEFDGDLWSFASRGSRKVEHVGTTPQVDVTVSSASTWVSLTGAATVVEDALPRRRLWNAGVEAWFPDGPEDPSIVLLRVEADSAEYWDSPRGGIATALSFVKAKATGTPSSGGDNERVAL